MIHLQRIPFSDLVFLDDNPRTRTPEGLQRMADDIAADPTFFDNRPVLVNHTAGQYRVYAGDLRAHAAHDVLGWHDIWRINRDASSTYEHPTQKPVALPERAIKNSCPPDGLIFEPFGGSGSTLVAAHQLNRRCYGLEIDPHYCQVIIDRMHKLAPELPIAINGKPYNPQE